jgi:multidrug efflux system outer membrane protein
VRAEYEGAAASIPQIEGQIVQLENALSILLGRNPGPIPRQGRTLGALAMPAVPTGVPSELLERRPDIRQAEQSLIAANAQIGAAKALYFPSISLTGLLGGVSTELSTLFGGGSRTWSYAGSITGPIFTAGNIEGQVILAEGGQQQALLSYQQTIQNAFADVEDALVSYQSQGQQLEALGRQLGALKTYVRLAQLQFDAGYTDYLTVLDANRNLFSSELVATSTRAGTFAAMVGIYQAMGGGWVTVAAERAGGTVPPPTDDAGPPG